MLVSMVFVVCCRQHKTINPFVTHLLVEMFSVSTSKSMNTTVSWFVNFCYHNRLESLQYQNFCMCYILVLSYISAPFVSPTCTHFEGVLISHSVPSTSCSAWVKYKPQKYSLFCVLSHIIRSHILFLSLKIVWTLVIKPSTACFTALRRKFLSLQSL